MVPAPIQSPIADRNPGRGFSVLDLPNLAAWWSADYGVLTSVGPAVPAEENDTVRRWLDRSGNGRHLDQATLLNQPMLTAGGITFDGTNDFFAVAKFLGLEEKSMIAVYTPKRTAGYDAICGEGSGDEYFFLVFGDIAQGDPIFVGSGGNITDFDPTTLDRKIAVVSVSDSASTLYRNGQQVATGAASQAIGSSDFAVGRLSTGGGYAQMDLQEIIVTTSALNPVFVSKVTRYLARKWGVQI